MTRTCREEKHSTRTVRSKTLRRKAIKKGAAKSEKGFLGKEKHMRFTTTWHREITVKGPRNKRKKSSVDLARRKRKLLSEENVKIFHVLANESAVGVLVACSDTIHPYLLRLEPAAASSSIDFAQSLRYARYPQPSPPHTISRRRQPVPPASTVPGTRTARHSRSGPPLQSARCPPPPPAVARAPGAYSRRQPLPLTTPVRRYARRSPSPSAKAPPSPRGRLRALLTYPHTPPED
jgi:hypothetical protein